MRLVANSALAALATAGALLCVSGTPCDFQDQPAIGNNVWFDADGNGIRDDGEPGLAEVTVTLKGTQEHAAQIKTTDRAGKYWFGALAPNAPHQVCFDPRYATGFPDGVRRDQLVPTVADVGDDTTDSDIDERACVSVVTPYGGKDRTVDAGYAVDARSR